jgi:tetratricopeptide (TPR) repeat protein
VLTLIVSLLAGAATTGLLLTVVHSTAGAVVPGIVVALGVVVLVLRSVGKKIMPLVDEAQRHMGASRKEMALESLKAGLKYQAWHPLIASQLRTQIGALHYIGGDYDEALVELKQASSRPWESSAYLACTYFKKHDEDNMVKAFEKMLKVAKGADGLPWNIYAWCLVACGKREEAVSVLKRGIEKLPADDRLKNSLEQVQEGKKPKVAPYAERWAAFGLDGTVAGLPKGAPKGYAQRPGFRPGFRQRPLRKKR